MAYEVRVDSVVEIVLQAPKQSWKRYFENELKPHLVYALTSILKKPGKVTPSYRLILRPFSYFDVEATRIVIIGQDPYNTDGVATGLAFECLGQRKQPSLQNIRAALGEVDLDFDSAAKQGVLFLNAALTTIVGKSDQHATEWSPFVTNIIRLINAVVTTPVVYLLWGKNAQALVTPWVTNPAHKILTWSHPSPQADNMIKDPTKKFKACDHFKQTSFITWTKVEKKHSTIVELPHIEEFEVHVRALSKNPGLAVTTDYVLKNDSYTAYYIRWMRKEYPREGEIVHIWTDGSSYPNNTKDPAAAAGWGYAIIADGAKVAYTTDYGKTTGGQTNNRGELQAVLEALKKLDPRQRAVLHTDSEYVRGILSGEYKKADKNLDMINEFNHLKDYIIEIEWIRGHTGLHDMNTLADELANLGRGLHYQPNN